MEKKETVDVIQLFTFIIDNEIYAIDVLKVKEVLEYVSITNIPRTPEVIKGVINLRGNVVPVLDIRNKFGLIEGEITIDTCILVLEVDFENELLVVGIMVDGVKEVLEIEKRKIDKTPKMATKIKNDFIYGIGMSEDEKSKFIIILDIDKIISSEEMLFNEENIMENDEK